MRRVESLESNLRFEIETINRTYFLEANNYQELKMWISAFNKMKYDVDSSPSNDQKEISHSDSLENTLRNPDWEGYLTKQGVNRKNWKRRWFVLKYPNFYYLTSIQVFFFISS